MQSWLLLLLSCFLHLLVSGEGANGFGDTCAKTITGVQEHWVGTPKCFNLKETNDVGKAFSCVKITVNDTKCGIRHGHKLADVEESGFSLSNIASAFLRIFTIFSPTPNIHRPSLCLSPFEKQYIQVECDRSDFRITISTVLNKSCILYMAFGVLLFYSAERLSMSVKFYYTGGVGIGILASLLVLTFVLSRLVPKRPAMYAILVGGWSFSAWVVNLLWHNWNVLLAKYYSYFLMYIGITGFCSFVFCYWNGPVENPRSQNIVKWGLQLLGLLFLYNSSQLPMVSLTILLVVTVMKLQSEGHVMKKVANVFSWRMRPQPRKLLTEEEYRQQAEIETKKALEELRVFCHSPECSPWKTLSRIKSPERFIKFVDGDDHLTDAEMTLHDADFSESENEEAALITDDENSINDKSNNGAVAGEPDPLISDDDSS